MPATNGIIQFKYGLQEKYDSLATKDLNTIYFTTNEQRLFVGDVEYSRPVGHGTSLPAAFVPANSMFVVEDGTRRELHYSKDGSAWELVAVLPAEITAGIVGANTAGAVGFGGTIKIPKITYDKHGNITAAEDVEVVLPSETPVDVEVVKQGDGNAVTEITADGDTVTYKMGATFATADDLAATDEVADAAAAAAAAAQETADKGVADAATAQTKANEAASAAETAQGEVDALEAIVEANETDIEGKMTALTERVSTNEGNIAKKQDALEFNTAYNKDTNKVATMTDVTNAVAGLSGAMHFKGAVSELPATAEAGDVYLVGNKEYVWDGTQGKFVELGDETIYAVKGNIKDADIAADAAIAQSKIAGLPELAEQVNTNKDDISDLKNDTHTHDNKNVIDGITAGQVTNWDDANSKKHTHDNKALLDTYTQTETDLADAVSKKHNHTNKSTLDGITDAKVAAWDAAEQNAKDYADDLDEAMGTRVGTAEGKVTALEGKMTAAEGNITTLQNTKQDTVTFNTAYDATTNKAATMADVAAASLVWQTI